MNRREFTTSLGMGSIAFGLGGRKRSGAIRPKKEPPRRGMTIDDFMWNKSVRLTPDERNRAMLGALQSHGGLKAALFVAGRYADNEKGKDLLRQWDRAGHLIG